MAGLEPAIWRGTRGERSPGRSPAMTRREQRINAKFVQGRPVFAPMGLDPGDDDRWSGAWAFALAGAYFGEPPVPRESEEICLRPEETNDQAKLFSGRGPGKEPETGIDVGV
jgi:hypothetical protein